MATSATASRSTPRWERAGESGTAFTALGRPGRGSRGRGGHRGGRGAGRGNPRESKSTSEDTTTPPKQDPSPPPINPSATPSAQPLPAITSDQTSASSSKIKPSSRKPSRATPSPLNVQVTVQVTPPQTAPSPSSARTPNKRRRSQAGKPNGNNPAKMPAVSKDTNKSRPESGPATSAKDTPPHLQHRLDVRQGIDALVERVRAVAMDNRPTTPGSHIDWAGDDDDSLPDLNDWGVNTSTFASTDSASISPIILEGLKPLPDITAPALASPLWQVLTMDGKPGDNSTEEGSIPPVDDVSSLTPSMNDHDAPITTTNTPIVLKTAPGQVSEVKATPGPEQQSLPKPPPSAKVGHSKSPVSNGRPWHPSLPAKPVVSSIVPLKLRPGATSMRSHVHVKSPANKDILPPKNDSPVQTNAPGTDAALSTKSTYPVPPIPDLVPAQEKMTMQQDQEPIAESISTSASNDRSTSLDVGPQSNGIVAIDDNKVEGLEASMHAPKAKSISTSTPTEMSSYSQSQASAIPRNRYWNNAKDQTPGQVYPEPRSSNGDHQGRSSRSAAGRGGSHGRNHSAPNVGSQNSHQRVHGSRPVITGDALSRIARTIVNTST